MTKVGERLIKAAKQASAMAQDPDFARYEALRTAGKIVSTIDDHLLTNPFLAENPELADMTEKAFNAVLNLWRAIEKTQYSRTQDFIPKSEK